MEFRYPAHKSLILGPVLNQFHSVHTLNHCGIAPYPEPV